MSSFLPAKQNFPIWKGATFRYAFTFQTASLVEGKEVRKPQDLTGWEGETTLVGDDGSELLLNLGNNGIIFGGQTARETKNGLIEILISQTQTAAITWTKYAKYTLYVKEPLADKLPLMSGQFHIAGPPL